MPQTGVHLRDRLIRRWYLTLVGLIATGGLCVLAMSLVPVTHQAQANILLTPPDGSSGPKTNPYFSLIGLQPLADAVGRTMTSGTVVAKLRSEGLTGTYTVARDQTIEGPILIATVDTTTAPEALKDLNLVVAQAGPALTTIQNANVVPPANQVYALQISRPTKASRVIKSQLRALVAAAAVGLVGTAVVVSGIDALLLRRRRRKSEQSGSATGDSDVATGPAVSDPPPAPPVVWRPEDYIVTKPQEGRPAAEPAASAEAHQPTSTDRAPAGPRRPQPRAPIATSPPTSAARESANGSASNGQPTPSTAGRDGVPGSESHKANSEETVSLFTRPPESSRPRRS
jgi:hypothetical protein